jgi:hypothetical protein
VAASHLLAWLAETGLPWLVVLDDLNDAAVLEGLWPWGVNGRVVVTTSRPDTAVKAPSPRVVEVGPFSRRESLNYLSTKLHEDPDQWIGALDLALDLGFLPIALAQAGALMADAGSTAASTAPGSPSRGSSWALRPVPVDGGCDRCISA